MKNNSPPPQASPGPYGEGCIPGGLPPGSRPAGGCMSGKLFLKLFPLRGKCIPYGESYPWFPGVASRLRLEASGVARCIDYYNNQGFSPSGEMHAPPGKLPLVPWGCIEAPSGASKLFKKCIGPRGPKLPAASGRMHPPGSLRGG